MSLVSDVSVAGPAAGVRVVVVGHALPLASASMILADMGADVVLVEDPDAPNAFDQAAPSIDGIGHQRLAFGRNKRSVALRLSTGADRETFASLLQRADVVLYDSAGAEASAVRPLLDNAAAKRPDLITCDGATWGSFGEHAGRPGQDFELQAASGCMDLTGELGHPPARAGIQLFDLVTGTYIAIATLAALIGRQSTGRGARVEVAGYDAAVVLLTNMASAYFANGEFRSRLGTGHISIFPYNAFSTSDGEVVVAIFTQAFWTKFCEGIGLAYLLDNPKYKTIADRMAAKDELSAILEAHFLKKSTDEWAAILEKADVPYGPVLSVERALALPQTTERGMVPEIAGLSKPMRTVGSPLGFEFADGTRYRAPARRAPRIGDDDVRKILDAWGSTPAAVPAKANGPAGLPLAGVKVLDFTRMMAGPWAAEILSDLGATVTKLEEPRIGDPTRRHSPFLGDESSYFVSVNRGKQSLAIDVRTDEGRKAVLALAREADIVVENFRPGVMDRLGLGYATLKASNPGIVFCSLSGFGATGPMQERISFDIVNQAFAGLIEMTGHPGKRAARIGVPIGDLSGGQYMTLAVLAGLHHRKRTGQGCYVDLGLHDTLISLLGDAAQRFYISGASPSRAGNRHHALAPHDCFQTSDGWVAVAAVTQPAWQSLAKVLGLTADEAKPFESADARLAQADALHALLQGRFARQTSSHWARALRQAGVSCEPVATVKEVLDSSVLASRGLAYDRATGDRANFRLLASPMVFDSARLGVGSRAPKLGEHSAAILGGLGYDAATIKVMTTPPPRPERKPREPEKQEG